MGRGDVTNPETDRRVKHGYLRGYVRHPLYAVWRTMHDRCENPNAEKYPSYGERGITVCARWSGPRGFPNFLADMGERPENTSLDRIDNDGNYEPTNCRWATPKEQAANRRPQTRPTHCKNGHPFTEASAYTNPITGRRRCRICAAKYMREKRAANG